MSATTVTSCKTTTTTTTFFPFSAPKPQSSPSKQLLYSYRCSTSSFVFSQFHVSSPSPLSCKLYPRSVSSSETNVVDEEAEESGTPPSDDVRSLDCGSLPPLTGCKACGKADIERGCNGEGRIQGGIATVPGLGWWPIKAYRPCPAYVASGGRYRRTGQSMDQVISGSGGRNA